MFGKQFYPTPPNLAEIMLEGIDFNKIESTLEPSAGKGDLAAALAKHIQSAKSRSYRMEEDEYLFDGIDLDTIEIDPHLRNVLKGRGVRVIHDDFLTFESRKKYDLIAMNPPFASGARHLLYALKMLEHGGQIVCLLNAETTRNPSSDEQRALMSKLEGLNADIEYAKEAFMQAERKTAVEVAIVKVAIPKPHFDSIFIQSARDKTKTHPNGLVVQEGLTEIEYLNTIVAQYDFEIDAGIRLIREHNAMQPYILDEFQKDGEVSNYSHAALTLNVSHGYGSHDPATINKYIRIIRMKYWSALFKNPRFVGMLTSNLQDEYHNKVSELSEFDFSLFNILTIQAEMNMQMVRGVEETILALFDELSHKHHYLDETSRNVHYFNGWKTNKAHMINHKVIIPLQAFRDGYQRVTFEPSYYSTTGKLADIEKVFNYLDDGNTNHVDLNWVLKEAGETEQSRNIQLKYFSVTFYKKGSCHIKFHDERLLKKLNIFGCQKKGWLPPDYGKSHYSDMSQEAQAVVDAFDGGAMEYEQVVQNSDYYLYKAEDILCLEMGEPA